MPPKPVLAIALLLPIGVWSLAAKVDHSQNQLITECRQKLSRLGFKGTVAVGVDKFDVTVTGMVPTLEDRAKVRDALDAIRGLRCVEDTSPGSLNHLRGLRVPPILSGVREDDGPLFLSGQLSSNQSLESVKQLITQAEPRIKIDDRAVQIHPSVDASQESLPLTIQAASVEPLTAAVWKEVHVAFPVIEISYPNEGPVISGRFPNKNLQAQILQTLRQARPDLAIRQGALAIDASLPPIEFTPPTSTGAFTPPAWFAATWEAWKSRPFLDAQFSEGTVKLAGFLPNAAVSEAVMRILRKARPELTFSDLLVRIGTAQLDVPIKESADLTAWTPPTWMMPLWKKLGLKFVSSQSP